MKRGAILFVVLALLATRTFSQRNLEDVQVTLVEVPVNVIDANGRPVTGLTAANFELYDEGKKRPITHFDTVDVRTHMRIAATAPEESGIEQRPYMRNFMLLFDTSDSNPGALARARAAALTFVSEQVQPTDRVAVATVSVERGFQLLANFTLDREFLRATIITLGDPKHFTTNDPLRLAAGDFELQAKSGRDLEKLAAQTALTLASEHAADVAREQQRNVREQQRARILRRIENLADLGRVLDRVAGRKQVILLSMGFDAKALHGRENLSSEEAKKEREYIERGQIWNVDTESRFGSPEGLTSLKNMTETLKRADVVLHAVDIAGVRNLLAESGERATSSESLSLLTRDTGGTVFRNSNDLGQNLARMLTQQDVTYVLGFQTAGDGSGKFHNLRVKLVNAPAGARVTHRLGYFEQSKATIDLDRALSAGEILMNSIPLDDLRVRAFAAAYPRKVGAAQAPVVLEVDGRSLLEGARGKDVLADFYIYAFDEKDVVRDFAHQRVTFELNKLRAKLEAKGVKYYSTLLLPPGEFNLRVLVRTTDGRSGFTAARVHVPTDGEPIASPVLFDESNGWVMVKAQDRALAPVYPFLAGDTSFVPAARAQFAAGAPYTVAVMTYNLAPDKVRIDATLEGDGAPRPLTLSFLGRTNPDIDGGVKLMYEVKPPHLAKGDYRLVMKVRTAENAPAKSVTVPVEVQ
jgi:VWFA-related protein